MVLFFGLHVELCCLARGGPIDTDPDPTTCLANALRYLGRDDCPSRFRAADDARGLKSTRRPASHPVQKARCQVTKDSRNVGAGGEGWEEQDVRPRASVIPEEIP